MWHVTCDRWHVTCDMWHMTWDMWQVEGGEHSLSSLALTAWEWKFVEDLEEKEQWLNQSISDEAVCRTAPATPGLLIM